MEGWTITLCIQMKMGLFSKRGPFFAFWQPILFRFFSSSADAARKM